MKTQENSGFVVFTGTLIATGRLILGNINDVPDNAILVVMAIVNYVAFGFVFLFLHNDIINICLEKISKAGILTQNKDKARLLMHIPSGILLLIYLIMGIWYIASLKSSNLNDAISIVALTLSIASSGLAKTFSSLYSNILIKIATKKK